MNLQAYQEAAKRTCPVNLTGLVDYKSDYYKPLVDKLNLSHMVMGMGSELSELQDSYDSGDKVNIGEELADIMWYLANYCTFRNHTLYNLTVNNNFKNLKWNIAELTDLVKKYVAYNKPINEETEKTLIVSILLEVTIICDNYDLNLDRILENNIDKLKARYPDKFQENLALNRDLVAERKELEK